MIPDMGLTRSPFLLYSFGILLVLLGVWDSAVYFIHWNPTSYADGQFMFIVAFVVIIFYFVLASLFLFGYLRFKKR